MNINFRKFTSDDKELFFSMVKKFYAPPAVLHFPSDEVMMSSFYTSLEIPELVKGYMFEYDRSPAGYAIVSMKFETEVGGMAAWIEELFVEEEFRSKGIGRKFFEFLSEDLNGKIKRIRLEVGDENEGAKRLYNNLGFEFLDYKQMVIDKDF
ncbi:MAG: GNAT family N-acetyltransferase [Clostridia bacterium]|nr:GNAT family N-acetyltransferase [Clostridia bacterium]